MRKLVWKDGKPEWVKVTSEELNEEFRANHGGKSAIEMVAEKLGKGE